MPKPKRIGILTAGGDSPGLNAAIRGVGKSAIGAHGMQVIGFRDGITGLVENRWTALEEAGLAGILTVGGTVLGTSRDKVHRMQVDGQPRDMTAAVVKTYERERLDGLLMIGGGGTARQALRLLDAGLNVLTLPKAIENDIAGTDTSFGFATATEIATEALDRVHSTAHSHHRILLMEVRGHRAGWLALASGLAGGADVILIPEIPYTVDSVAHTIKARMARGSSFSVVAVAEGARDMDAADDFEAARSLVKDAADTPETLRAAKTHLGNVEDAQREHSFRLAHELEAVTGLEARVSILGYVQRGGTPCSADRLLGTRLGAAAADLAAKGRYGRMVAARGDGWAAVPLADIAGTVKSVPLNHGWIGAARKVGTGLGD